MWQCSSERLSRARGHIYVFIIRLVINHLGKTLVSSDCATIVRELEVVHPAAQMVALAAAAQDTEVGDGTRGHAAYTCEHIWAFF